MSQRVCLPPSEENADAQKHISKIERKNIDIQKERALSLLPRLEIKSIVIRPLDADTLSRYAFQVDSAKPGDVGSVDSTVMGTYADDVKCSTCDQDSMACNGHPGYIILPKMYIYPNLITIVFNTLKSVCNSCSRPLLCRELLRDLGILKTTGYGRLQRIADEISTKSSCTEQKSACLEGSCFLQQNNCSEHESHLEKQNVEKCTPNPQYRIVKPTDGLPFIGIINSNVKGAAPTRMDIGRIKEILESISLLDCELLGFMNGVRPHHFISPYMPVISMACRPAEYRGGLEPHPLTNAYRAVVSAVNAYKGVTINTATGMDVTGKQKYAMDVLEKTVSALMIGSDDTKSKFPQKIDSVRHIIAGKGGLIRSGLMGKRVDFCGRAVLSPGIVKFGEVEVPTIFQTEITTPVSVTRYNLEECQKLYDNGNVISVKMESKNNKTILYRVDGIFKKNHPNYQLRPGFLIMRKSQDGDFVMFNRQPTVHKQAMMGYSIRFSKHTTDPLGRQQPTWVIGNHISTSTPHNLDFDGDEGNIHKMQTADAQVEAETIANVRNCVMSAQNNQPIMGLVYNDPSAAYILTESEFDLRHPLNDKEREMLLSVVFDPENEVEQKERRSYDQRVAAAIRYDTTNSFKNGINSGRLIFSAIFPGDFWYEKKGKENTVKVVNGILVSGQISKSHIGTSRGSMIQSIWKWHGPMKTTQFITRGQFLLDKFLSIYGLTISYNDCFPETKEGQMEMERVKREARDKAEISLEMLGSNENLTAIERGAREDQILVILNNKQAMGMIIGNEVLSKNNPLNIMSKSGAKGSEPNTAQITASLGQQYIYGKRFKKILADGTKTLPYFPANPADTYLEAYGYCNNSFRDGLEPAELFFHAATSRTNIINTALRTADVGAINHRSIKCLEDVRVEYDGSVRNSSGNIFEFTYYDGFDAAELVTQKSSRMGDTVSFINVKELVGRVHMLEPLVESKWQRTYKFKSLYDDSKMREILQSSMSRFGPTVFSSIQEQLESRDNTDESIFNRLAKEYAIRTSSQESINEIGQNRLTSVLKEVKNEVNITPSTSILDFGGGDGNAAVIASREFKIPQIDVTDYDSDSTITSPHIRYKKLMGSTLPYSNNQFDIVVSLLGFHHASDRKKLIDEFYRIISPNGSLIIQENDVAEGYSNLLDVVHGMYAYVSGKKKETKSFDELKYSYTTADQLNEDLHGKFVLTYFRQIGNPQDRSSRMTGAANEVQNSYIAVYRKLPLNSKEFRPIRSRQLPTIATAYE